MARLAREQGLEVMQPELGTKPARLLQESVALYDLLHRRLACRRQANGVVDCVEGASVRLFKNGAVVAQAATDNYGDFKFDRLAENSGDYTVEIAAGGGAKKTVAAKLGASINLGEIRL